MRCYIIFTVLLCGLLIFFSCSNEKKDVLDFNDYSFNTDINGQGLYNIGYEFNINGKYYANKNYNFVYITKGLEEERILVPDTFTKNKYIIYWREVHLPFKIIKKADSDTLIIIKNDRKFIFKRLKNSM
ncbi:hypothetical protein [uncultured Chryseobacterium sp.]|uniref:hypothetical protein n=1 Tax=uncultured Chryseobacterium sp. TaxID=259322 RepID=UPI0025D4B76E|nr:hypothetical protein [uncultured Chryseobacterium sp.]